MIGTLAADVVAMAIAIVGVSISTGVMVTAVMVARRNKVLCRENAELLGQVEDVWTRNAKLRDQKTDLLVMVERIRARHGREPGGSCRWCLESWPCRELRLLEDIDGENARD